jgi:RimJ/RimL family protein N-acetyltransferase
VGFPEAIETERLLLRRPRAGDRDVMAAIRSEPEVWRFLGDGPPPDATAGFTRFDHHVDHWEQHGFGLLMAELRTGGEVVGWTGPAHPDQVPGLEQAVEVGWTLRPDQWGRGLATEAAAAAVTAAFEHLALGEVISLIDSSNERSLAVARRLGMRHTRDVWHALAGELGVYAVAREAWSRAASETR